MIQLQIEVKDREVAALLEGIERRMEDQTPAFREIGEIIRESVMQNFREGRSPEGASWKPSKRAQSEGGKTLIDTATLRNSIHVQPARDHVLVGTPIQYAGTHQFGAAKGSFGTRIINIPSHRRGSWKTGVPVYVHAHKREVRLPWGDIPARPFLGVRDSDWPSIKDALVHHLTKGTR